MLNSQQLQQLSALAANAAQQAGDYIAAFDRRAIEVNCKLAGDSIASQVVTQVDLACETIIHNVLQPSFELFDIAFLGEESSSSCPIEQHPRLSRPYFWCVDPLDGTLPFTENVPGYAVSIGLVRQDGVPLLGVIYDPVTATLVQAIAGQTDVDVKPSLLKQGKPWSPTSRSIIGAKTPVLSVFFDRSFTALPTFPDVINATEQCAIRLGYDGIEVHHQAGSVMNALSVLQHGPGCYFKFPKATRGGGSLWDFAATAAVAKAAGIWVTDMMGEPLQLNAADSLFMNRRGVLYASDERLAHELMALYKAFC
ncbi:inositol-1-monophosphatase [Neiella marina]|uniref:Inositol-1-monophosphatase n=1 Tax=Neiella holothuriorum TaxID=2870530 RepID=A0ABS7EKC6_9GAMM|nr:inositol monophosphatase family protein [Neiella holothuriorum]MBW8192808.1 inositol-1-monophosphatase [Neiella holothuriorum]